MKSGTLNRIAGLIDPPSSTAQRSARQRQASRRNGSRSRGPITAEGKAAVRSNALKHGLFARVIMPPADARRHDRLYRQFRQELIDELKPTKFTEFRMVDSIAADYLQLARVGRMIEGLQRPASLPASLTKDWKQSRTINRSARSAERLLESIDGDRALSCPKKESVRLAGKIAEGVEHILNDHAQIEAEAMAETELSRSPGKCPAPDVADVGDVPDVRTLYPDDLDSEDAEIARIKECFVCVEPAAHRLQDKSYVAAVFRGERKAKRGDLPRLRRLLGKWCDCWKETQEHRRDIKKQVNGAVDQMELALAESPHELMLLLRYQRSIENAISKKLRQIRRE